MDEGYLCWSVIVSPDVHRAAFFFGKGGWGGDDLLTAFRATRIRCPIDFDSALKKDFGGESVPNPPGASSPPPSRASARVRLSTSRTSTWRSLKTKLQARRRTRRVHFSADTLERIFTL